MKSTKASKKQTEEGSKERLLRFLRQLQMGQNAFEKSVGITVGHISKVKKISFQMAEKISSKYPGLNMEWLLTGGGEYMYKDGEEFWHDPNWYKREHEWGGVPIPEWMAKRVEELEDTIELLQGVSGHFQEIVNMKTEEIERQKEIIIQQKAEIKKLKDKKK